MFTRQAEDTKKPLLSPLLSSILPLRYQRETETGRVLRIDDGNETSEVEIALVGIELECAARASPLLSRISLSTTPEESLRLIREVEFLRQLILFDDFFRDIHSSVRHTDFDIIMPHVVTLVESLRKSSEERLKAQHYNDKLVLKRSLHKHPRWPSVAERGVADKLPKFVTGISIGAALSLRDDRLYATLEYYCTSEELDQIETEDARIRKMQEILLGTERG